MRAHGRSTVFLGLTAILSLSLAHGALIGYGTYANVDEAYASAIASRLLDGQKLYEGAVSQRGPLMYESFALFARVFGWDDIVALRLGALLLALLHVALVYVAGRALLTRSAAFVAAAITTYALAFGFPAIDGIAVNGESLQIPFVIAGAAFGAIAMRRAPGSRLRIRDLAISGFAWGAAIAIKPQVFVQIVPIAAWLLIDARRRKSARQFLFRDLGIVLVATALVPALFFLHAVANGTATAFVYYTITYNARIHLASSAVPWASLVFTRLHEEPLFFVTLALLTAYGAVLARRRLRAATNEKSAWALVRGFGTRSYLALHLAIALVVAVMSERFFPHYFLIPFPFFAWLCGVVVAPLFRSESRAPMARALLVAFLSLTIGAAALECFMRERFDGRVAHDRTLRDVSSYVAKTTSPNDRIFVWGFSPWIYGYSQRKPAGRYVFSTYVTGFVPWFWESLAVEKNRIVPGSTEALLDDLKREDPAIVVDAGSIMMARPMRAYETPAAFLRERYCFEVRIGAYDVYRRKHPGLSCESPFFPEPHWAIDALGHPLPVQIAPVIHDDATRPLPISPYYAPVTFPGVRLNHDALATRMHPGDSIWAEEVDPADPTPASHPERTPPLLPSP